MLEIRGEEFLKQTLAEDGVAEEQMSAANDEAPRRDDDGQELFVGHVASSLSLARIAG